LQEFFGFDTFKGNQEQIIESLLSGKDTFVIMPTGGGKSLCYQLPALLGEGVAIVVSPLIALMQDQVDALQQLGVRAAFLNSSQTPEDARTVNSLLVNGELQILYVAPERLMLSGFLVQLAEIEARGFRLDEDVKGSGLGLSIVRDLAETYGLDIRYTRSNLGGLSVSIGKALSLQN